MQSVLGHDDAKDRFRRTLANGRLASTYLFVGPAGVGKRYFAERLAAALLCPRRDGASLEACGVCENCRLTAAGTHPDLLRVARPEGKTTLPVDLFIGPADRRNREGLCHDIALRPLVADRRVAIIDDADDFSVETANCLLKTLEEPPPGSLLILIGTSLARQLSTIRSRSQIVRFGRLEATEVASILCRQPDPLEPADAERLAAIAEGSVSRALELAEGQLDQARETLLRRLASPRLDANDLARVFEEETKAVATEPRIRRRAMRELLAATIATLHARLSTAADDPASVDALLRQLEACFEAESALGRNANQSAVVQSLAQQLARRAG
ncbi:DNA polymerase III subunit tau [Botrimarina colliarenosi]|uniref:DNA polymerase III subunit tau n=1 Tax=Botrimarina colliarenosi TaxID=2528001 RepID=A0A5C6A9F9_9BACT|nr:DNA polymerase III subunit [Botrimarina colliarenosi]TWT95987.1 DNA polymerase III subunit tau [Botrimarina colliarenosi]